MFLTPRRQCTWCRRQIRHTAWYLSSDNFGNTQPPNPARPSEAHRNRPALSLPRFSDLIFRCWPAHQLRPRLTCRLELGQRNFYRLLSREAPQERMRLLQRSDAGEFEFAENLTSDDTIPPYAILSHTWKRDTEVIFEDMKNHTGKNKPGYEKIRFCGEQARRDGLEYFWIDTCCINKESYAELSQAINSMFRWYRNATRCYVYLSDVSSPLSDTNDEFNPRPWEADFWKSKWFTRGWTLQELLAPRSVEFFSREHKRLGDKSSLEQQIHEITGVPKSALQGAPLSQFSVNERLSWIERRQTTVEEDKAYSLLGIFDVYMPLIYREGTASAFKRLREEIEKLEKCLQDLRLTDPRDDKKRIEDTKGGLLEDSYRWVLENSDFQRWSSAQQSQSQLLWIKGDPGKGKTMLLCGIINELNKSMAKTALLSYFFCQAADSRINNAIAVLRGLIYLLVDQQPSLISHIRKKYDRAGKALFEDTNTWVVLCEIFTNILHDPSLSNTYLIIDALDECVADLPNLLDFIGQKSSVSSHVKWIVSSRNDFNIEWRLRLDGSGTRLSLELEENAKQVACAVNTYINHCLSELSEIQHNTELRDLVREKMLSKANGTFLWVSLVIKELKEVMSWDVLQVLEEVPTELKGMYHRMMKQIKLLRRNYPELCRQVLSTVIVAYRPLHLQELRVLSGLPTQVQNANQSIAAIVKMCGSFLTVQDDNVYIIHQSAKDYLSEEASHDIFPCGVGEAHHSIFSRSLQVMSRTLRRDIYGLHALGYPIERVEHPEPDPLAASRYSCLSWVDHLCNWNSNCCAKHGVDLQDGGAVEDFMRRKYLYWLEALSLCGSTSDGVGSMAKLETLLQGRTDASALFGLVRDAYRFIMYHKQAVENCPLQAYASALIFSPAHSLIRGLFKNEELKTIAIQPPIGDEWSACLQTLEGHYGSVRSIAFSHDSTQLASASDDKTVKIWDTRTGTYLQTLKGHSNWVTSVAFSPDSTQLASASDDKTIKIWDTRSGACLQTLEGHRDWVKSIAYSHDSTRLASASTDRTVKIWDTRSSTCLQTLEGYSGFVWSVAFSGDSTRLASALANTMVKIWDTRSGTCLQTLEGHSSWVISVAYSHDSTRLASASGDRTIKIWDTKSGACLQTLEGHRDLVKSVAFSHNSTRLASASEDTTAKIWDTRSGACLQTLEGHRNWVWSVAFSHDSTRLASASEDKTVKIWDITGDGACLQTPEGHYDSVRSVAFSYDSTRLASASADRTIKIWDTGGTCLQTLEGHRDWVKSIAFSYDSTQLASASDDKTVKIWDITGDGTCLQTLKGHRRSIRSIAFSGNSTQLASASDKTVRIWHTRGGICLQTLEGHRDLVSSVAFSHNSTRLASASEDKTVKIWDITGDGACLQTLEGHSRRVISVAFSGDSTWLASASGDRTVKIWDVTSDGACLQTLEGHRDLVKSVAFSHDSARLASASDDKTVKIWDTRSGACLQTLDIGKRLSEISFDATGSCLHTEIGTIAINASSASYTTPNVTKPQDLRFQGAGVSSDGVWITYNSENLVWLPSEYRPFRSAVSGKTIGIGVNSGKIWMCRFNIENS
ncbi:WD40-repeat-containing domain protein [Lineolata rhizophorae]|uniref:WD40-repeat-containing domain protein n=1 Tax=Lineolata rhizophorae TaxID=578093 RepID=A0A6A6NUA6_9PEZI|nr:WD40-repeat-containing domain protein [Lineolata rhizophorae]